MAKQVTTVRLVAQLLERIDRVADARGESRSITIERMLENEVGGEELFMRAVETRIGRGLVEAVAASPSLIKALMALAGEEFTDDDIAAMKKNVKAVTRKGRQRESDKKQQKTRKDLVKEG